MTARERTLTRIAHALGPNPEVPSIPRGYRQAEEGRSAPERVDRFCERAADYRATVTRVDADGIERAISDACAARGSKRLVAAPGVGWAVADLSVVHDRPERPPAELDALDAALTGCALAIAETGTIVLDGGALCGRRALTLVPDHHVCVVRADQIVADVPEAMDALHSAARAGLPTTLISGPSATSDIELRRVEGVHGPRLLDVIVAE